MKTHRFRRWVLIVCSAFAAVFFLLQLWAAATSSDPKLYIPFTIRRYQTPLVTIAFLATTLWGLRRYNRSSEKNISPWAWSSLVIGLLNPDILDRFFHLAGIPFVVRGSSEMWSFSTGVVAIGLGTIALQDCIRSRGEIQGRWLAWIGIGLGLWWAGSWAWLLIRYAAALSVL